MNFIAMSWREVWFNSVRKYLGKEERVKCERKRKTERETEQMEARRKERQGVLRRGTVVSLLLLKTVVAIGI